MAVASGVIVAWPSTNASIPAGWVRETALDGRFVKMVALAATNPGTTGGSATHDHPLTAHTHPISHSHSGTVDAETNAASDDSTASGASGAPHDHTYTMSDPGLTSAASGAVTSATGTSEPPQLVVIFIKSDGTPTGLPNGSLAFFNATAPSGWTAHATSASRFWKGAATAGDGGATGGTSNAHAHTSAHGHSSPGSHTHPISTSNNSNNEGDDDAGTSSAGIHSHGGTSDGGTTPGLTSDATAVSNGDAEPPWTKLRAIENTSGAASLPTNVIALWLGLAASVPTHWRTCDGNNGTPTLLDRFIKGASADGEIGNTGGTLTHTHAYTHGHTADAAHGHTGTTGNPSTTVSNAGSGGDNIAFNPHQHTIPASNSVTPSVTNTATTLSANTDNRPAYTEVHFIQYQQTPPAAPTINLPVAGTIYDGNLTISATSTDPDGDSYFASFEYDRSDNNWTSIGDGATVASGAASTRSWDVSGLARGTNYRVRARSIDPSGSNTYSAYTTTAAFTIGNRPTVTSLNSPVPSASYSTSTTLDATLSDADSGATIYATFEYRKGAGAWTTIGVGTTVSTGGRSTRLWDISALTPGIDYEVRAKATDDLALDSTLWTESGDFIIGPSQTAIHAEHNTAFFRPVINTAGFRDEPNTATYHAVKD